VTPRAKRRRSPVPREERARRSAAQKGSDVERFWRHVAKMPGDDACWMWIGARNRQGYGVFFVGSRLDDSRRTVLAHRFAYELTNGALGEGQVLLHSCDTPGCVRHLRAGSQAENVADMHAKGRGKLPPGRKGPRGIAALLECAPTSPRATERLRDVAPRLVGAEGW